MPLIATPISHLFEDPAIGFEIARVSDCLELRQRSVVNTSPNQLLFHVDIDLTHPWNDEIKNYLEGVFASKKDLNLVTFQATRCCTGEVIHDGIFQMSGQSLSRQEMLINSQFNVRWLRSKLGYSIDIGIENNNYYPAEAYSIVCDGDFLSEVTRLNQIYFLFDIAHAMVSAHNKGINYQSYIATLPLDRVIQLHICEPYIPINLSEIARDIHECPSDKMLNDVHGLIIKYSSIKYMTIEYYKNEKFLIESILKLKNICSS
jgi:hypothetical protein